jgi:hypothetical protein
VKKRKEDSELVPGGEPESNISSMKERSLSRGAEGSFCPFAAADDGRDLTTSALNQPSW